ncbi:unnamed protein product, partial [Mesorhabditis belari]|uniref:Uncharacterized protein n=1 Tax=Mesorhabditis belari TaxID=2138241 RepID=A0AAF3ESH6_9BILA
MSIELWSKGVLWDKLLGVALLPLHQVLFSAQPGAGRWLQIDAEVETRGGVAVGTRSPTGHSLLVDARFELPFDAAPGEAELLQSRLDQLNRLQLEVDASLPPRAPLNHSGYSEDSDYTSDVSFPIHPNSSHPNSSVHQWDSHLHPHRPHHRHNTGNHHDHIASYEGDEDAYNETRIDQDYDEAVTRHYDSNDYDYRAEDENQRVSRRDEEEDELYQRHRIDSTDIDPTHNYPSQGGGPSRGRQGRQAATRENNTHYHHDESRYDQYRSEDESTYKGESRAHGYVDHYDSASAYDQQQEDDYGDEYGVSEMEYDGYHPKNPREVLMDRRIDSPHTPQSDYSRSVSAAGRPSSQANHTYASYGHNGYGDEYGQNNGYREEDEDRYISDGGKGYTADYDTYGEGTSEPMREEDDGRRSSTWADTEPLSYNSRPPRSNSRRTYADRYEDDDYMNEEEEDRLRAEEEAEERWRLERESDERRERERLEQQRILDEQPTYTEDRDYSAQGTSFADSVPPIPNHAPSTSMDIHQQTSDSRRNSGSTGRDSRNEPYNWRNDDRRPSLENARAGSAMQREDRPMVTIVEESSLREKREKRDLHELWHWAYRQVCTNLGYKKNGNYCKQ